MITKIEKKASSRALLFKSLKITAGAILAILIASCLGLKYSATAGIITILSIQNTKKETIQTAFARAAAFGCALVLSFACYRLLDYTVLAFGVYLLGFTLICLTFGWTAAIAMDSVLITHFLVEKTMDLPMVTNEIGLFVIGAGIGVLLNLHLHPRENEWRKQMDEADEAIRAIVQRMAQRIRTLDRTNYDGSCFVMLDKQLEAAKQLALTNMDNTFGTPSCYELDYVQMRQMQSQVLRQIYNSIQMIAYLPAQAPVIADFFEQIGREYARTNDVRKLLDTLHELILSMRSEALPQKREEFESRAVLFYILKQLEEFLLVKKNFVLRHQKRVS